MLHLTQNIQKPEKNSLCCIGPKPYIDLKFKIKLFFHDKNQENNLCIAFDSDHTKTRKELPVLHLNQTIHKVKIKKKIILSRENPGKQSLYFISLKTYKKKKRTLCAAFKPNHT